MNPVRQARTSEELDRHLDALVQWDQVQLRDMVTWTRAQVETEIARTRDIRQRARLSFVGVGASVVSTGAFGAMAKPLVEGGMVSAAVGLIAALLLAAIVGSTVASWFAYKVFEVGSWPVVTTDVLVPVLPPPVGKAGENYYANIVLHLREILAAQTRGNEARVEHLRHAEGIVAATGVCTSALACVFLLGVLMRTCFGG